MSHEAFNYISTQHIYSCRIFASVCFFISSFYVGLEVNAQFMHDLNRVLETVSFVSSLAFSYDANYYSNRVLHMALFS